MRRRAETGHVEPDVIIAVAACRKDQHHYPKYIVDYEMATCMADGQERDECECAMKQMQRMARYVEFVQHDLLHGQYPPGVTVARAKCVKNQHHYPKWGVDAIVKSCLGKGATQKECECELRERQKLEKFEDYVRWAIEGGAQPRAAMIAVAQCKEDQHHYPVNIVEAYMSACMQQGDTRDKCACMIEYVQRALPYSAFVDRNPHTEVLKAAVIKCSGF